MFTLLSGKEFYTVELQDVKFKKRFLLELNWYFITPTLYRVEKKKKFNSRKLRLYENQVYKVKDMFSKERY